MKNPPPAPPLRERLNPDTFLEVYEGVRERSDAQGRHFIFDDMKGCRGYLEVIVFLDNTFYMFILDNFPAPRRKFTTEVPYWSLEQFEADLKRMNIPMPKRKAAYSAPEPTWRDTFWTSTTVRVILLALLFASIVLGWHLTFN